MRIISVRAKLDGVGHYRVSIPALALRDRGHTVDILDGKDMRVCNKWFAGYDVCILQNLVDTGWLEVIKTIPGEYRPITVGCIDDLVDGLDETNPLFEQYRKAAPKFLECMPLCDGMIFSTSRIAGHYGYLNPRYCIVPNCLDIPGYRDWDTPDFGRDSRLTIGWLGGTQHVKDEEPMREGLRRFLQFHPEVLFAFCGNKDLGTLWKRSIGIPDKQWKYLKPTEFDGYQTRISHFDIGVAPLRSTEFNRCKSDLRLLEYGAWGVPYVASDITPYRGFYEQSKAYGGRLARDAREWEFSLQCWMNASLRKSEGMLLKSYVRDHRGHYACGELWERALWGLLKDKVIWNADTETASSGSRLDAEYKRLDASEGGSVS